VTWLWALVPLAVAVVLVGVVVLVVVCGRET
jgi:hypothetical protein